MSNEISKTESNAIDGFDGYEDSIEGADQSRSGGVIQGTLVKFTNEAKWVSRDGEEIPPDRELIVVGVNRVVQKWVDSQPVETIILESGQKYPDINKLNDAAPRDEWVEGPDGKQRGPWQAQRITYLLNLQTMERLSFPTGTVGGGIAVRELVDKINWMRRYRGAGIYPVVTLADMFMHTRFGGRQRPHFNIKRWVTFDGDSEIKALPPAPNAPAPNEERLVEKAAKVSVAKKGGARNVAPPSHAEDMNDEIPF